MRKRVRTCSEISSIAERLVTGSVWARYFMASTSRRCPSTYRGSEVRSLLGPRPSLGGTGIVKTLAMGKLERDSRAVYRPADIFQYTFLGFGFNHLPAGRDEFCFPRGFQTKYIATDLG